MLAAMPSYLLSEWMAYFALEPFGPLRDDMRAGQIAAILADGTYKRAERFRSDDFFPSLTPEPPDPEDLMAMQIERLRAIGFAAAAHFPNPETA